MKNKLRGFKEFEKVREILGKIHSQNDLDVSINILEILDCNQGILNVLKDIKHFRSNIGIGYYLVLEKERPECGIYAVTKSLKGYESKLNSNNQGWVYLGTTDKQGILKLNIND